jgi:hypothetical protein
MLPLSPGCGGAQRSFDQPTGLSKRWDSLTSTAGPNRSDPEHHSEAWLKGEPDRLVEDIVRAIEELNWAVLRVRHPALGSEGQPGLSQLDVADPEGPLGQALAHAVVTALRPDDREVRIEAWAFPKAQVYTRVRVGLFGDPPAERRFLASLRDFLLGPPPRPYRGDFQPPPWPLLPDEPSDSPARHLPKPTSPP